MSDSTIVADVESEESVLAETEVSQESEGQDLSSDDEQKSLSQRDDVVQRILEKRKPEVQANQSEEISDTDIEATGETSGETEGAVEETATLAEPVALKAPDTILVKVNGIEKEVPRDDVITQGIRTLQKESTADLRLREVAERKQELDRREAALSEALREYNQSVPDKAIEKRKGDFASALIEDEDAAAEMFAESEARVVAMEAKLSQLAESVVQSQEYVRNQQISEKQGLVSTFKREYPNLAGDSNLMRMANSRTIEIMQEHPEMSHNDIVLQAGKDVSEYLSSLVGAPVSEDDAYTVKQSMPRPVKRASGRKPGKPEPKKKTTADVIREMQERRSPN